MVLDELKNKLNRREVQILSPHATLSSQGQRRRSETILETDYRQAFAVDVDRILHSLAYTRYIDKTQVFYLINNDHITHRVLHVQLVSKIARTIGRFLGLNEDLIEAIALGHDIGHPPFGHDGERVLSDLCREHGIGYFLHNVQSVQFLDQVEKKGQGWNLCLQTLDGILGHDGEVHNRTLRPEKKKSPQSLDRYLTIMVQDPTLELVPMTLEGCVVRMSDTISYIGRDIEDAIRLNMIKRADIPDQCVRVLGNTNGTMVHRLVTDVIDNSYGKDYIAFSQEISGALKTLKEFNLNRIYMNARIKKHLKNIQQLYRYLFETLLEDLSQQRRRSVIFTHFLENMNSTYLEKYNEAEIVRDFIAGMTDQYFLRLCPASIRPKYQTNA
jgi:dGTPase